MSIFTNFSELGLGTWALGGDIWWGKQEDRISNETMAAAVSSGINFFDTAPVYGRGRSERLIGDFLRKRKLRDKIILATKAGLSWEGAKIYHDLSEKKILKEIDESRRRLQTDYFDIYQVHWPDPNTPISETARTFEKLKEKGIIKAIGLSNFNFLQLKEFSKFSPVDSLQSEYSLFNRELEKDIIPYCQKNNIKILTYSPLYSGLLTGKFFLEPREKVPEDRIRQTKKEEFEEPRFTINRQALESLNKIAEGYKKTLAQLMLNWNFSQPGISLAIAGARTPEQARENSLSLGWEISQADMEKINNISKIREAKIKEFKKR